MPVNPIEQNQNAFLHFFRFNVKTFTTLLRVFYDDLRTVDLNHMQDVGDDDTEGAHLVTRLTGTARRILPALRLYSCWLLPMTHLMDGLSADDTLKDSIDQFWPIYAKAVDLVATVFPIWDFDDLPELTYMLEEDAETRGFKPLMGEKTNMIWYDNVTGAEKPRFSSLGVQRVSVDGEMLARVRGFLVDGLNLANDDNLAPIKLTQSRILHRDAQDVEPMPVKPKMAAATTAAPTGEISSRQVPAKPLSYAAAAANASAKPPANGTAKDQGVPPNSGVSRHAQLSRMVDDLVDDDESNNPVTPPQQYHSTPAVVTDMSYSALPGSTGGFAQMSSYAYPLQKPIGSGPGLETSPPVIRTPKDAVSSKPNDRLHSVANIWNDSPVPHSSPFPSGLPTGTLGSPAHFNSRGHSRVNSASSIRSRTSQTVNLGIADSWSSIECAPHAGQQEDKLRAWNRAAESLPQQYRMDAAAAGSAKRVVTPSAPPIIKETFKKTATGQKLGAPRRYKETEYTVHDARGSTAVASLSPPPAALATGLGAGLGLEQSSVASPLLFGAGGSVWSTGYGQGG